MKKIFYTVLALTLVFIAACKKTDTSQPVITLKGHNPDVVVFGSASSYTDPGAVVVDDIDGTISYVLTGSVYMDSAGVYKLIYTATDAALNKDTVSRNVVVDAAPYLSGIYTIDNYITTAFDSTYNDTIAITTKNNQIEFKNFGTLKNAKVLGTIKGSQITIPSQVVSCGTPAHNKTFSGSGSFTSDSVFTINYSITDTTFQYSGHGNYIKN